MNAGQVLRVALLAFFIGIAVESTASHAQTRIDAVTQIRNLPPIVSIARSQCIPPQPAVPGKDCTGLMLLKFTLADGTVKGPYVIVPADSGIIASLDFTDWPIQRTDPVVPKQLP